MGFEKILIMKKLLIFLSIVYVLSLFIVIRKYNSKLEDLEKNNKTLYNKLIQYKFDAEVLEEGLDAVGKVGISFRECIDYMITDSSSFISDSAMIMINDSKNKVSDIQSKYIQYTDSMIHQYESYLKP